MYSFFPLDLHLHSFLLNLHQRDGIQPTIYKLENQADKKNKVEHLALCYKENPEADVDVVTVSTQKLKEGMFRNL